MRIHKEVEYPVSPEKVYGLLTNTELFAAATGMPAEIGKGEGAAFSLFGGVVEGRQLALEPGHKLTQAWRFAQWEPGIYSIVQFTLSGDETHTKLQVDQDAHPEEWHEHLSTNWPNFYLEPFGRHLAS